MENHGLSSQNPPNSKPEHETYNTKAILRLAIPALGALIIEPLLTFIDSVMVGHLGVKPLAGLAIGAALLTTLVGVFVFLAYATTATTARFVGAGDRGAALRSGVSAIWLASGLGVAVVLVLELAAPQLARFLGAEPDVLPYAVEYLRAGAPGAAGMLIVLAATGTLRGLLDTKTPLMVLAAAAPINIGGNFLFIYGLNLGILGAGISLSLTQLLMAAVLVLLVFRAARAEKVSLRPAGAGIWSSVLEGLPLFWRTVSLRIALLATLSVAAAAGTTALAAHQVVMSLWTMVAFGLDALAIAAQGLVGVALGANHQAALRTLVRKVSLWGICAGAILGVLMIATSAWTPTFFGSEPEMHRVATPALIVAGAFLPIGALVFELDGVLIGANEGTYLAWMGIVTLVLYLPALGAVYLLTRGPEALTTAQQATILMWIWVAFAGWFMALRTTTNWLRARHLGSTVVTPPGRPTNPPSA